MPSGTLSWLFAQSKYKEVWIYSRSRTICEQLQFFACSSVTCPDTPGPQSVGCCWSALVINPCAFKLVIILSFFQFSRCHFGLFLCICLHICVLLCLHWIGPLRDGRKCSGLRWIESWFFQFLSILAASLQELSSQTVWCCSFSVGLFFFNHYNRFSPFASLHPGAVGVCYHAPPSPISSQPQKMPNPVVTMSHVQEPNRESSGAVMEKVRLNVFISLLFSR